jgi:ubiquinone/menaquinone biosynthesis C-methylase UbiE
VRLIADAVGEQGGTWADLGAGDGTFTRALLELLGPSGRVYAVDRDRRSLSALDDVPGVERIVADFQKTLALPELDGILIANALHFVRDQKQVLARLVEHVKPNGRVVIVEYDRRAASQWVPFPISSAALPALCKAAGLGDPTIVARRPSAYAGDLYAAFATRLGGSPAL